MKCGDRQASKTSGLSTAVFKMLIKYFGNIFWIKKIIYNIV